MIDSLPKGILFNPRSADSKHRIPNSILQVGGAIGDRCTPIFVDGNLEQDPLERIVSYFEEGKILFFGVTVMPGPQLRQAIPITRFIKENYPDTTIVWGGYFAANQHKVVLQSGTVDYVINGPGDEAFPLLIDFLKSERDSRTDIPNLIWMEGNELVKTRKEALPDMDNLPPFPYEKLNQFYPIRGYIARTFLGQRTLSYHSSFGCPFTCSFCAVVPIYNARWKGLGADRMENDMQHFKDTYDIDAIEFHDNNFFTSRKRVVEFSERIRNKGISWWGEGRIDTINKYSDDDLRLMKEAGLRMIFLGAESGDDEVLKQMDKGGTQSGEQILSFAGRLGKIGIIPEYSFVLGLPGATEQDVTHQIRKDIRFIRKVKKINPATEIIIYVYSPVPTEGSDLHARIVSEGFRFPEQLEDWLSPSWERFDLRRNPLTPWLKPKHIRTIQHFETVLNAMYPTVSDFRIRGWKKTILRSLAFWRYRLGIYQYPYELKLLLRIWKYRQPEEQGFYSE